MKRFLFFCGLLFCFQGYLFSALSVGQKDRFYKYAEKTGLDKKIALNRDYWFTGPWQQPFGGVVKKMTTDVPLRDNLNPSLFNVSFLLLVALDYSKDLTALIIINDILFSPDIKKVKESTKLTKEQKDRFTSYARSLKGAAYDQCLNASMRFGLVNITKGLKRKRPNFFGLKITVGDLIKLVGLSPMRVVGQPNGEDLNYILTGTR